MSLSAINSTRYEMATTRRVKEHPSYAISSVYQLILEAFKAVCRKAAITSNTCTVNNGKHTCASNFPPSLSPLQLSDIASASPRVTCDDATCDCRCEKKKSKNIKNKRQERHRTPKGGDRLSPFHNPVAKGGHYTRADPSIRPRRSRQASSAATNARLPIQSDS